MRVKEVSLTISKTINLGNYESLRVEAGMVIEVDSLGNEQDAWEQASADIHRELALQIKEHSNA
jgi:hypothetical protein|tara:strand:+ start:872 stop:1063 length:192 start_codon:yes stop_codon:yes gene_type:complete